MTALEWLDSLQGSGIRPGLGRMRRLLRGLRNPERACRSIVVAGTNGKGSTAAMLASILNEAGYRTGLYTSPHLVDLRERWMIGGELIDEPLLKSSIDSLQIAAERTGVTPTYFEALTLIAFIAFERAACEIVVLEVGMGGRLDATNVTRPIAALITPIGLDHTEFLGKTVRKIAREKAGVIRRGAIVLTSNEDEAVLGVLRKRAAQFGNEFIQVTDEHETPLVGDFQRRNAALAARAARELRPILPRISEAAIERGVARTRWRGRLEHIDVLGKDVWIDGGHNFHAVTRTAPFLDRAVPRPRLLLFGIMNDKDVDAIVRRLFPLFDRVVVTEPYAPRSVDAGALASSTGAVAIPDPEVALRHAIDSPERGIVVTGSLYLAGAAIAFFESIGEHHREKKKE